MNGEPGRTEGDFEFPNNSMKYLIVTRVVKKILTTIKILTCLQDHITDLLSQSR
jgi:hypothetical protein